MLLINYPHLHFRSVGSNVPDPNSRLCAFNLIVMQIKRKGIYLYSEIFKTSVRDPAPFPSLPLKRPRSRLSNTVQNKGLKIILSKLEKVPIKDYWLDAISSIYFLGPWYKSFWNNLPGEWDAMAEVTEKFLLISDNFRKSLMKLCWIRHFPLLNNILLFNDLDLKYKVF